MRWVLAILAVLAFLAGAGTLVAAQTVFVEMQGMIFLLISAVFLSGLAIVETIISTAARR